MLGSCEIKRIRNKSFGNTWVELCKTIVQNGYEYETEYMNRARYITSAVLLDKHAVSEIEELSLHQSFPTRELHLRKYLEQFENTGDLTISEFDYTYYKRLEKQLEILKDRINVIGSRRRVAVTWIPTIDTAFINPPCLIYLNLFNMDGINVQLFLHWRSRDIYNAWQSNLCGIVYMLNKHVLKPNNLKIVCINEFIDNAHIYGYNWKDVDALKYIPENPQLRYE